MVRNGKLFNSRAGRARRIFLLRLASYRALRQSGAIIDLMVAAASFSLAYAVAYGYPQFIHVPGFGLKVLLFLIICEFTFFAVSLHRGSWRYVSMPDLQKIVEASIIPVLLFTAGSFVVSRGINVSRSVPILTILFMIFGLSAPRVGYRLMMEQWSLSFQLRRRRDDKLRYALLCGVSDKAETLIRAVRASSNSRLRIVGMVDDSRVNQARSIRGVRVLGTLKQLDGVMSRLAMRGILVRELIVAETAPSRKRLLEIVEAGTARGLSVSRVPDLTDTTQITSGALLETKPIELSDLLERSEVRPEVEEVGRLINGHTILVTGAGGSIGSELSRQIAHFSPSRMIATDNSEFHLYKLDMELREAFPNISIISRIVDIRDKRRVNALFSEFQPEVVFHAAALKHVPLVESNPVEAIKTNVFGTCNVADAAVAASSSVFVMVSTDKAVNPTNVMGATKRAAESYCQALDLSATCTRFKTVRFGNVLGSNGSVVPRFQEQIARGGPVTVTHPHITRYFMTIPEAVRLILQACAHAVDRRFERGRIMVLDMGKPVRIADLAERMIQLAGFRPGIDIEIVFTGLRPGEKLYEELFDQSEIQDTRTDEGYVVAFPRIADKVFLDKTLSALRLAIQDEDRVKAVQLLSTLVPEYSAMSPSSVYTTHTSGEQNRAL